MKAIQLIQRSALILTLLSMPMFAQADEGVQAEKVAARTLIFGGTQQSNQSNYTYLGAIRPIWGGELGQGWFQSLIASWLAYQYEVTFNNQPDTLKAKAPGIDAGLGYAWTGHDYTLNFSVAAGYRHYNLSPNVPGEKPEGSVFNLTPQIQAGYQLTKLIDIALLSNYSFGQQSNFNRVRLGAKYIDNWHLGLEAMYQEGRNYRIQQHGLFATHYFNNGVSLELSGGQLKSQDDKTTGYFGVAFSKLF